MSSVVFIDPAWTPFQKQIVRWVYAQRGVRGTPGKNNAGDPSRLYQGGFVEPWCAHFAATAYRAAGCPLPGDVVPDVRAGTRNPIALVATLEAEAQRAGWWHGPQERPQPGDVVLFSNRQGSEKSKGPIGRHCGIVVRVFDNSFTSIEGNLGTLDYVGAVVHKIGKAEITGWVRPPAS